MGWSLFLSFIRQVQTKALRGFLSCLLRYDMGKGVFLLKWMKLWNTTPVGAMLDLKNL